MYVSKVAKLAYAVMHVPIGMLLIGLYVNRMGSTEQVLPEGLVRRNPFLQQVMSAWESNSDRYIPTSLVTLLEEILV